MIEDLQLNGLHYQVISNATGRMIVIRADYLMRYAFYTNNKPVQFKRVGGKCITISAEKIDVCRKPSASTVHKEYMSHNARGLWLGSTYKDIDGPAFDRLLHNMQEYEGQI